MITAIAGLFGPDPEPTAAIVTAARRARRQYPELAVDAAIAAWLDNGDVRRRASRHDPGVPPCAAPAWLTAANPGGCVSCGQPGHIRHELPLQSVVCDSCMAAAAAA
jgi:hypothetical protein